MPSIIILNDDGNVLFHNLKENVEDLLKAIQNDNSIPGLSLSTPEVRLHGLVIFAEQTPLPRANVPVLSMKQAQVLQNMAMALTPEQTALKMKISEPTVRLHIHALKKKFKTVSRDQMMAMAGSLGLCDPFEGNEYGKNLGD